ncbi:MAG: hypothetical protein K2J77_09610 [Oscillospiraceae bacterium]|nr:hypothetical protein [Oscillospiraceae bacterium]
MNETIVKKLRGGITGALVLSAIVALLGAIAIFVTMGMASDEQYVLIEILVSAWDLLRMGGFGMFTCSLISVIFELFGKAPGKLYAFVMLGGSVFGLISGFMLSISSMLKTAMQTYSSFLGDSNGSEIFIPASVFGIVSAVIVFVGLGMRGMKPHSAAYPPQYPGYPQYPQQSVPVPPPVDINKQ